MASDVRKLCYIDGLQYTRSKLGSLSHFSSLVCSSDGGLRTAGPWKRTISTKQKRPNVTIAKRRIGLGIAMPISSQVCICQMQEGDSLHRGMFDGGGQHPLLPSDRIADVASYPGHLTPKTRGRAACGDLQSFEIRSIWYCCDDTNARQIDCI